MNILKICYLILGMVLSIDLLCAKQFLANKNFKYIVALSHSGQTILSSAANDLCHPASLVKKMTLYMLFEQLKQGKINMNTRFRVSKLATRQAPSKLHLRCGSTIAVCDIIKALIVVSANDVAVVAAEGLYGSVASFTKLMNQKAKKLGMSKTIFTNCNGLPDPRQVTTASDMLILAQKLMKDFPKYYPLFKSKSFKYEQKVYTTHNHLLNKCSGVDGIKTGYTAASGFNVSASVERNLLNGQKVRLIAVVMGGKSHGARDLKTAELIDQALKTVNNNPIRYLNGLPNTNNSCKTLENEYTAKKKLIIENDQIISRIKLLQTNFTPDNIDKIINKI